MHAPDPHGDDIGVEIDFGTDKPGAVLQRKEKGHWHDYLIDGKPVTNPFDVETLVPGKYRLVEKSSPSHL